VEQCTFGEANSCWASREITNILTELPCPQQIDTGQYVAFRFTAFETSCVIRLRYITTARLVSLPSTTLSYDKPTSEIYVTALFAYEVHVV
jgi:hypothetical protein